MGRYNIVESHPKVVGNVLIVWIGDHLGMTHRILAFGIDPGVQGRNVDVGLFTRGGINHIVQTAGIGAPAEESMAWIEWWNRLPGLEKLDDGGQSSRFCLPLTFPHDLVL